MQHVFDHEERRAANDPANAHSSRSLPASRAGRVAPTIVIGGDTGSHLVDLEDGIVTEVQAGSYVPMEEGYRSVDFHGTGEPAFDFAMLVVLSVIRHSANGEAITDGGSKSFAVDGPPPRVYRDGVEIGTIAWAGDEFGRARLRRHRPTPAGARLECAVPHCDPTANLHDFIHVVRGEWLEATWPIEARGLSD